MNTSFQNLGFRRVEGSIRLGGIPDAGLRRQGSFLSALDGAYIASFQQQASPAEPVRELIDTYGRPNFVGAPRSAGDMRLRVRHAFNYTDPYEDVIGDRIWVDYNTTFDVCSSIASGSRKRTTAAPAGDKKMVVDPACSLASRRTQCLDGFAVRVGVRNIFDDPPPFADNVGRLSRAAERPAPTLRLFDIEKKF